MPTKPKIAAFRHPRWKMGMRQCSSTPVNRLLRVLAMLVMPFARSALTLTPVSPPRTLRRVLPLDLSVVEFSR